MIKPILSVDFDGVIHSYTSGWQGASKIPDMPVPGALEFLVEATHYFKINIYSCRSNQFGGRRAMKRWFKKHYFDLGMSLSGADKETFENPFWKFISKTAFADPWKDEVNWAIRRLFREIKFPRRKPSAFLMIDDRCFCFKGTFPDTAEMLKFSTWNKQPI